MPPFSSMTATVLGLLGPSSNPDSSALPPPARAPIKRSGTTKKMRTITVRSFASQTKYSLIKVLYFELTGVEQREKNDSDEKRSGRAVKYHRALSGGGGIYGELGDRLG